MVTVVAVGEGVEITGAKFPTYNVTTSTIVLWSSIVVATVNLQVSLFQLAISGVF